MFFLPGGEEKGPKYRQQYLDPDRGCVVKGKMTQNSEI